MIKKENRLSRSRLVGRVLQKGLSIKTSNLSCRIISTRDTDKVKITVVVSKKIASHAVDRNRIKRRVREAFEAEIARKRSVSLVVFPKLSAQTAKFEDLQKEASVCLETGPVVN